MARKDLKGRNTTWPKGVLRKRPGKHEIDADRIKNEPPETGSKKKLVCRCRWKQADPKIKFRRMKMVKMEPVPSASSNGSAPATLAPSSNGSAPSTLAPASTARASTDPAPPSSLSRTRRRVSFDDKVDVAGAPKDKNRRKDDKVAVAPKDSDKVEGAVAPKDSDKVEGADASVSDDNNAMLLTVSNASGWSPRAIA